MGRNALCGACIDVGGKIWHKIKELNFQKEKQPVKTVTLEFEGIFFDI
jgi:hypothetical protein